MATKIYSADIFIGSGSTQIILTSFVIKKLPLHIHLSNLSLIKKLIRRTGEKYWNAAKKKKTDDMPAIKIEYKKYLGTVINEPEYEEG